MEDLYTVQTVHFLFNDVVLMTKKKYKEVSLGKGPSSPAGSVFCTFISFFCWEVDSLFLRFLYFLYAYSQNLQWSSLAGFIIDILFLFRYVMLMWMNCMKTFIHVGKKMSFCLELNQHKKRKRIGVCTYFKFVINIFS